MQYYSTGSVVAGRPLRKKGAQPRNANARTHGLYSMYDPSVLSPISGSLRILSLLRIYYAASDRAALARSVYEVSIASRRIDQLVSAFRGIQNMVTSIFDRANDRTELDLLLASVDLSCRISNQINKVLLVHELPQIEVEYAALLSYPLILWDIKHYYGIVRDVELDYSICSHSFQKTPQKSGQKSLRIPPELARLWWIQAAREPEFTSVLPGGNAPAPTYYIDAPDEYGWLTEQQWQLLAPLLPPLTRKKARGRPAASSRAIISAILWKIANAASWHDLPARFPSKRTCRRFHKRWFLSGRMLTLYKVLMHDLLSRGRVHPLDFAEEGYFRIGIDHHIYPTRACPDTWQTRTALLLVQYSYAVMRRIRREQKSGNFPDAKLVAALREQILAMRLNAVSDA